MLADWSAECAVDDPVLVVPWSANPTDPAKGSRFVDLRENPYDVDHIPEAEQHPPLLHALRALNAPRSPVFTAKCDAWPLDAEQREDLRLNLDPTLLDVSFGFGSYIDLVWRDRSIFASFHQLEQVLARYTRRAAALDQPFAALECVIRPALMDFTVPQEGFAVSLYVKALGPEAEDAWRHWAEALDAVILLLRSKEMAFS